MSIWQPSSRSRQPRGIAGEPRGAESTQRWLPVAVQHPVFEGSNFAGRLTRADAERLHDARQVVGMHPRLAGIDSRRSRLIVTRSPTWPLEFGRDDRTGCVTTSQLQKPMPEGRAPPPRGRERASLSACSAALRSDMSIPTPSRPAPFVDAVSAAAGEQVPAIFARLP